ncbi:pentatricopeptide repeat-containing protein At1g74630 [Andrographis paniculata]|uniref:pentatricopeptide repeat-containing protein At1g74630 n=1 Tax=Andrographis paniculata TaxID=175694 RepID=UPI0021E83AEA|nr:pentatricopeptide repeat-containing protein At1g74630 [Andrographis paniculata]
MQMNNAEQFCTLLSKTCKSLRSLLQFHAHATKSGLDSDLLVAGNLLLHCAVNLSGAALRHAALLLRHSPNPDPFMYNTLIRGFSQSHSPHKSISTFSQMLKNPNSPLDSFTFAFTLKSAANMRCLRTGTQLHSQALLRGLRSHLFVGTTLLSMYAECGRIEFAQKVFDEMPDRNIATWNALVTAFFRSGDVIGAERVFNSMPAKGLISHNLMIAGYAKFGEFVLAEKVFDEMPSRDDVSWGTMIVGFAQHGWFDHAFRYFRELVRAGTTPSEVSLTGVLSACAQMGALEFTKILQCYIEKVGLLWMIAANNALIDAYSKCGYTDTARLVFERMPGGKSVVSWTSIIGGLAMQGYAEEALNLFSKMEASRIYPDGTTFIAVLYACSHAGLVDRGREIFDKMSRVYGVEPRIEHYGCMVDLYGRAGQLTKAYEFVIDMPVRANDVIWRTLLGSCTFHGNVKLAEEVRGRLSELDPGNSGDHVLLSNVYACAGKWKDAASVRKAMAERNLAKTPGWSMVEVNKAMYTFVAGVKEDDVTMEAYEKLKEVMARVRVEGGYVPEVVDVLHDIEEEEKAGAIVAHSEKLAVAFAMARAAAAAAPGNGNGNGGVVRVVKNLRVCKDCHGVMKLISKVYEIEILLRDRSRFHSFRKGICSCRDYW